jgi:16S rRNA pseudouridine516 synthase
MRLDKAAALSGLTRTEARKAILSGRVKVKGESVRDAAAQVDPADVTVDGHAVQAGDIYVMVNKPAGVVTATEDKRQKTVLDLIEEPKRKDIFPVGRLDKDTEGLLLITNDGDLAHNLLSPKKHADKVYFVRLTGLVTGEDVTAFAAGLYVDETLTALPAELVILSTDAEKNTSECEITIREGKFHQVKRMFAAVGKEVIYLKRLSMGPLALDPGLPVGAWRRLTAEEIRALTEQ